MPANREKLEKAIKQLTCDGLGAALQPLVSFHENQPIIPQMFLFALALGMKTLTTGQWTAPNGARVSVIFVLPKMKQACRPDGSPIELHTLPMATKPIWTGRETDPIAVALVAPPALPGGEPSVKFKLPATPDLDASFITATAGGKVWISGLRMPPGQPSQQDMAVGISTGNWKVYSWIALAKAGKPVHAIAHGGQPTRIEVTGTRPSHAGPYTMVATPTPPLNSPAAYEIIVRDSSGNNLTLVNTNPIEGRPGWTNFTFQGDFSTVSRVELASRPLAWHTIRAAHFKP